MECLIVVMPVIPPPPPLNGDRIHNLPRWILQEGGRRDVCTFLSVLTHNPKITTPQAKSRHCNEPQRSYTPQIPRLFSV